MPAPDVVIFAFAVCSLRDSRTVEIVNMNRKQRESTTDTYINMAELNGSLGAVLMALGPGVRASHAWAYSVRVHVCLCLCMCVVNEFRLSLIVMSLYAACNKGCRKETKSPQPCGRHTHRTHAACLYSHATSLATE